MGERGNGDLWSVNWEVYSGGITTEFSNLHARFAVKGDRDVIGKVR